MTIDEVQIEIEKTKEDLKKTLNNSHEPMDIITWLMEYQKRFTILYGKMEILLKKERS